MSSSLLESGTIAARRRRGSRPPVFDADLHKGRNIVERSSAPVKQRRGLATRYDRNAII
ncbi:hypothetical protein JIM95_002095 [Corynebacterium sp. CCM 8835]|uniref:Transposase n=1 Tax=Corynebacterium antarcticum TaxID=2800405 RepID=A0ABS1FJM2_9CORY|nr:transposase [Corynebacterium antarcticum]MCK7641717.1 hypothetical protein [Corynebacterium antarcticum]MCK7660187.1 hypothetical protein [Corynebacterium antarcticum]MCL0244945.1 hypothetical protein [Corynebacterium antarcticum]MCX7491319.1 hypothetical protein [Corynebacterium antarcticum]MCX7539501.1 hypothetical protein [Corynebacterium antarcticum]